MGNQAMDNDYPLITRKIQIPDRSGTLLRRERLVGFLHRNTNHRLVLITAGAGYGKTSLLIDYAHDADLPVCWYSLDGSDGHVFTFIEYLVASLRRRFPAFGDSVLRALREFTGPPEDIEPFIRLLLDEMQRSIHDYFVLILDDYQEVLESEPVNALVDGLLRYLPENGHIIIASRAIPRRLTLTRLAAREDIVGLGVSQLKFTRSEIEQILQLRGLTDLSPEQLDALSQRSEGWITAILLAAQTQWSDTIQRIVALSGSLDTVFEYLAREVLAQQPESVQHFMLASSILEQMSPPLCDGLLQTTDSARTLRMLSEQGLFTYEISNAAGWYQYHQLFREFLRAKLEAEHPAEYRELWLRHARMMANQGNWARAIDGYISGAAFVDAAGAIEIVAQDYFDTGRSATLLGWIERLPNSVVMRHPRLLLIGAQIHTEAGAYERAEALLEPAYCVYRERSSNIGTARVLVQRAIVQRLQERYREAIVSFDEVLRTVSFRQDPSSVVKAHHNLGICYQILGDTDRGRQEMRTALDLAQSQGDIQSAAYVAHDLGNSYYLEGSIDEARRYMHQALFHWRKVGNPSDLALTLQGLGVLHHHLGEYTEAQNRFEESLEKARSVENRRLEAYALLNSGDLERDRGRYQQALRFYAEAMQTASAVRQSGLMLYILASQGETYRLQHRTTMARQTLAEALDHSVRQGLEEPIGLCHLAFGALSLQEGALGQAAEHLQAALELLMRSGSQRDLGRVHIQRALLGHLRNDRGSVLAELFRAGEIAFHLGTEQFIVAEGAHALPLLPYMSESRIAGLDPTSIRAQIEELFPSVVMLPHPRRERPNVQLELLGLDRARILYQGQDVHDFDSAVARTLAFLMAEHPGGLHKERIVDLLWPDTSQARAESLFHSTLYRLRKALDKQVVVAQGSIYQLNPNLTYRYDVADFEQLAHKGLQEGYSAHYARMNAIDLYQSDYLEACDHPWCNDLRNTLQHLMIQLLIKEAEYLAEADQVL
ncbi:MAG: tetratricopeptide repeat protein, partial [Chloroflexi bacterium]|nr:tetratricopeptide repeat protein [Chloroflexota bacterium]